MLFVSDLNWFKLIEMNPHELDAVEDLLLMANQADTNALDVSAKDKAKWSLDGEPMLCTHQYSYLELLLPDPLTSI